MEFNQVRPGIFTAILDEEQATATVLVGESRCLLVDTGASPARGVEIRQAVHQITDKPLEIVVLTHGHWDHCFGLSAFSDLETIGHERLADDIGCIENRQWASQQSISLPDLAVPATRLSLIGVRSLDGLTVEIAHFGPAHTRCDLIVAIPQRSTIIVGDLVETGPPQFDEMSSLEGCVKSLDSLYSMLKNDTLVVLGHGQPTGPTELARFRTGLAALWDQSEWGFRNNIPADKLYSHGNLDWPWDRITTEKAISIAYQELSHRHVSIHPAM